MKTSLAVLVGVLVLALAPMAGAQVPNADLAAKITAARGANAALMKQYSWNSRTELTKDGSVKDVRLESITYGRDGSLQRTLINDDPSSVPRGFLRRAIAEHEKKEMEKYLTGLRNLLEKYTLPSAGKILDFVSQSAVKGVKASDGSGLIEISGTGVVDAGDSLTMSVDPGTAQTRKMVIKTKYEGAAVTATATFKTNKAGLTYMQFAEVEVPDKGMTLQVHNYDYQSNN